MLQRKVEELLESMDGKNVDFYLEDDMFEIEGTVKKEGNQIVVQDLECVGHMLELIGDKLIIFLKNGRLKAERMDKSRTFEMEINRVYYKLEDPMPNDFEQIEVKRKISQFFKKQSDTLVWHEKEKNCWMVELNKINMYFSGERFKYPSLQELFDHHKEVMEGSWQAVQFSAEVEA